MGPQAPPTRGDAPPRARGRRVRSRGGSDRFAAHYIVQVTKQGEIWGIDNFWLQSRRVDHEAKILAHLGNHNGRPKKSVVRFFEDVFARALGNHLRFARECLKVTSRVTVIAGFTGIQGFETNFPPPRAGWDPTVRVGTAAGPDIVSTIPDVSLDREDGPQL